MRSSGGPHSGTWTKPALKTWNTADRAQPDMNATRTTRWQVVGASTIGTIIEWYDFYLYGTAAALVLNRVFFPHLDPLAGILASYATFAAGFLVRPLGR